MRIMSNKKNPMRPDVPHHIKESLTEIIDYLWEDEAKHAQESASNDPEKHICAHLKRVRAWLETCD